MNLSEGFEYNNIHASEQALATLLDGLNALVYVADIHAHELVFLNEFGRKN